MSTDDQIRSVADVSQRNQNWILTYIAPLFIILGVIAAGAYYYINTKAHDAEVQEQRRAAAARARISLQGRLEDCRIDRAGRRTNCGLTVTPTDSAKRILSLLAQFPVGFYGGRVGFGGSLNGGEISVEEGMQYLALRALPFFQNRPPVQGATVPVPLIIYSVYEFEGQEHSDRSLYYLWYGLPPGRPGHVIPVNLLYCGRLGPEVPPIDFLIDPWVIPTVGHDSRPSHSLMFDCNGSATLVFVERGEFTALSDVSPGQKSAPTQGRTFSISPGSLRFQSATNQEMRANVRVIDVGGPTPLNMPLPSP